MPQGHAPISERTEMRFRKEPDAETLALARLAGQFALYFGSGRYAITYGLLADVACVAAAIWVAYLFFH